MQVLLISLTSALLAGTVHGGLHDAEQPMFLFSEFAHIVATHQMQQGVSQMSPSFVAGPVLAKQWSANVTAAKVGGPIVSTEVAQSYYDGQNQRYRVLTEGASDLFRPDGKVMIDQFVTNATGFNANMTLGTGDDAVCKPLHQPYSDPLAAIALASTRNGSSTVAGQPCALWTGGVATVAISVCIGSDGVPREMNLTITAGPAAGMTRQTWSDVKVGPPPEEVFAPSVACTSNYPTRACESTGTTTLDVYRIHSLSEPFSLEDRNIGDALGDMAFTCVSNGSGFGGASVVSWWKVEVSNAFGQYAYCLYNITGHKNYCMGGTGRQVGRESALGQGVGHLQGQCSANLDVGNWYSLPAGGQCADGQPMGTNGCTWRNAQRVRTVNISCIMNERSLAQSCKSEYGHAPFSKSAAIFKAALASADAAKGGCPDISPPADVMVDCRGRYKDKTTCDKDDACAWCTAGAVPPSCNTLAEAKSLPSGVFVCDKQEMHAIVV